MAKEIEYKFLVSSMPELFPKTQERIIQGYFVDPFKTNLTIRVRTSEYFSGHFIVKTESFITIKGPSKGMTRDEFEYKIPSNEATELIKLCGERLIKKTRTLHPYGNHIVELDRFHGHLTGLVVAEIEVKSEDEVVEFPSWFSKDVTLDHRYANSNLCVSGIPTEE